MVTLNPGNVSIQKNGRTLTILGAVMSIFSLVVGLLVLFVIPGRYPAVVGLELLMLAALFVVGIFLFVAGKIIERRMGRL